MSIPRMSLTQFAIARGLPTTHDVDSHIHAGLRSKPTTKTYQRWYDAELTRLQAGRDEAARLFRAAVNAGQIIDADQDVALERKAMGHPDNLSTQAAMRLLEKRRARTQEPSQ